MEYLKRLLDVKILLATLSNILAILFILKVVNTDQVEVINSIIALVVSTLTQVGILSQPNSTK